MILGSGSESCGWKQYDRVRNLPGSVLDLLLTPLTNREIIYFKKTMNVKDKIKGLGFICFPIVYLCIFYTSILKPAKIVQ